MVRPGRGTVATRSALYRVTMFLKPTGRVTAMIQQVRDKPVLMREMLGESLRELRMAESLTLREVSSRARVSLGYLSEIERGQKEASSELLNAICTALDVPLSQVLRRTSDKIEASGSVTTLPVRDARIAAA